MFLEVVNVTVPSGRVVTVRIKAEHVHMLYGNRPNSICLMRAETRALHPPQLSHWADIYGVLLRTRVSCTCSER
jgi:hypothetical protein